MSDNLPPKSYYTGLFDSLSRIQFNISRNPDDTFSTRPSLRIRHRDDEILIGLIGELLDSKDISFDLVSREYGYNYFHINQRRYLETIHNYIENESTQLIRELAFVHGPYKKYFDSASNSPEETYQLVKAIEDIHFDVSLSPKAPYPKPEELASEFNIETSRIDKLDIPVGNFRKGYPVEYIGGIVDSQAYFTTSIHETSYGIGYNMVPQIIIRRGGVHPAYASAVEAFCDEENLQYTSAGNIQTLYTVIDGSDAINDFAPKVGPYLIARRDELAYVHEELVPQFQADKHHTKQGFYDLLVDFQALNNSYRTRQRERKFTPKFFEKEWGGDINIRNKNN